VEIEQKTQGFHNEHTLLECMINIMTYMMRNGLEVP
jgi:hypothetical protein